MKLLSTLILISFQTVFNPYIHSSIYIHHTLSLPLHLKPSFKQLTPFKSLFCISSMACYTNMTCLIQLNSHCWDCANKVRAALNRHYGVTSVTVDSASDTVKVTGKVDPYDLLSVVQAYDIHARLLWAKPTPIYPYGYSCADQYWCNSQPYPSRVAGYYHQSYCARQHHAGPGCNIM